jgi:hypothetical protein
MPRHGRCRPRWLLSRKTIEAHLGRIFAKLGVRSRTELTRLIIQNGLGEGAQPSGAAL